MPINILEGSMELQLYFLKLSIAMPQITADVLTWVWNDSGSKASDSDSKYDPSSNSESESEGIGGDSTGNSSHMLKTPL